MITKITNIGFTLCSLATKFVELGPEFLTSFSEIKELGLRYCCLIFSKFDDEYLSRKYSFSESMSIFFDMPKVLFITQC